MLGLILLLRASSGPDTVLVHCNTLIIKRGWVRLAQVIDKLSVSYNAPLTDCSQTKTLTENSNSDGKEKPIESGELKLKLG